MQWFGADAITVRSGQVLGGKYRLLSPIGEGGMGAVWSAVHVDLERTVAIKFLRRSALPTAVERFAREAHQAAHVTHRYVVDVFDSGVTEEGTHYMVQELLQGTELAHCIYEGPAWDVRDALRFVGQCLTALEAVHGAGLVHRDIKPENIFVTEDCEGPYPKLLDFGTCEPKGQAPRPRPPPDDRRARKSRAPSEHPPAARLVTEGTPAYMAPEQLRGLVSVDGRADLYSVGVMVYEWLTGRHPYERDSPEELCLEIAARSHVPLVLLRPDLGMALSDLVSRALSPLPEERFASAAAMRSSLLEVAAQLEPALTVVQKEESRGPIGSKTARLLTAASSPFGHEHGSSARSVLPPRKRRRSLLWPVAAAAVVLLATGSLFGLRRREPPVLAPSVPLVRHLEPRRLSAPSPGVPPSTTLEASEPAPARAAQLLPELELSAEPERPLRARRPQPAVLRLRLAPDVVTVRAPTPRLEDVRLEIASQASRSIEPLLEERELTGQDLRRLGL